MCHYQMYFSVTSNLHAAAQSSDGCARTTACLNVAENPVQACFSAQLSDWEKLRFYDKASSAHGQRGDGAVELHAYHNLLCSSP